MRFTFLSTLFGEPWGGSEELWSRAALILRAAGHSAAVSVTDWDPAPARIGELLAAGCDVRRRARSISFPRRLLLGALGQGGAQPEYRWIEASKPDLTVVCQGGNVEGLHWMDAAAGRKLPYAIVSQAAAEADWPGDDGIVRLSELHDLARAVFYVSQANLELTRRQLANDLPNARVVRNPFNVAWTSAPGWPTEETFTLACVGRLNIRAKGQDVLFDVLRDPKWRARPLRVRLYGQGMHAGGLRALKEFWKLEQVEFGGFVDSVERIWEECHALVLPSRQEGLPLAAVEAMLCGRPCIVTDVAGNCEVVDDNETGFVAKAATPAALDEAMERAWQQRERWREMGAEAGRRIRRLVPSDPARIFADQLIELAHP